MNRGLTYGVRSRFAVGRATGHFSISSFTKNESAGELVEVALDEMARFAGDGPTAEEVCPRHELPGGPLSALARDPRPVGRPHRRRLDLRLRGRGGRRIPGSDPGGHPRAGAGGDGPPPAARGRRGPRGGAGRAAREAARPVRPGRGVAGAAGDVTPRGPPRRRRTSPRWRSRPGASWFRAGARRSRPSGRRPRRSSGRSGWCTGSTAERAASSCWRAAPTSTAASARSSSSTRSRSATWRWSGEPCPATCGSTSRSPPGRKGRMRAGEGLPGARPSTTFVRPVLPFGDAATLVEAYPASGRTHQVRVHLAHAGHPLRRRPGLRGAASLARARRRRRRSSGRRSTPPRSSSCTRCRGSRSGSRRPLPADMKRALAALRAAQASKSG